MEPRRAERGGGEPTVGGRAIVRARWGIRSRFGFVSVVWVVGHRRGRKWRRLCRAPGERSREGTEGEWSQKETVSGHGVSGSRLVSGVAHPRPEYPVREVAHPKLGYPARGPAHPRPRQGRAGRGGESARADEINAKIVWIRQGGGARDIVDNRGEGQAGEEVGVSILLSRRYGRRKL